MPSVAVIFAELSAQDNLSPALNVAEKNVQNFAKQSANSLGDAGEAFAAFSGQVRPIILGLGAALATGLGFSIKKSLDFDSLTRGLEAVSGSAAEAESQLSRLKVIAELPGLGFEEAIQGSINLQAAGVSARMAEESLQGFGNALATVGRGKADLSGVVVALTQMAAKGKIMAQEINQIAERVPQIRKVLQQAFGTSSAEEIQEMGLTFEQFLGKVNAELGKLEKVSGGARNSLEVMGDSLMLAAKGVGDVFLPAVEGLSKAITAAAEAFNSLPDPIKAGISGTAALTLGLTLFVAAVSKAIQIARPFIAVLATMGITASKTTVEITALNASMMAGRGNAIFWGGAIKGVAAALAGGLVGAAVPATAAVGLMSLNMIKAAGAAEKARGEAERLSAVFYGEVHDSLTKASGKISELTKFWDEMSQMFNGKVPEAIVVGLQKELDRLGFKLLETGKIGKQAFTEMNEAAKGALDTFTASTMAIGARFQLGSTDRLGSLQEQLAATKRAIAQLTEATVLPQGVSADEFLRAAETKKRSQGELTRLVSNQKALEAEILKIETSQAAAKDRAAEADRKKAEALEAQQRFAQSIVDLLDRDSQNRQFATFAFGEGMISELDAAQQKLSSLDQLISDLFRIGPSKTGDHLIKAMKNREAAAIQLAVALENVAKADKKKELAEFYADRAQKEFIQNVLGMISSVTALIGPMNALAAGTEVAQKKTLGWIPGLAQVIQHLRYAKLGVEQLDGALDEGMTTMVDFTDEVKTQAESWADAFSNAFIDGLKRVREEGFGGLLRSFEQMLLDMAFAALNAKVFQILNSWLQDIIGGAMGGGGGGLGGIFGGDTAFSGGAGQGTPFGRLELPGAGGGGNVYVTVHAADADSFRRNEEQIHDAMFRASAKATRRNTGRI